MDLEGQLSVSYYETVAAISESHRIYLVRHRETGKFYIRKVLSVYQRSIYEFLRDHPVTGVPRILALCEEDGKLTTIEEYISGCTLEELITGHRLSGDDLLRIMSELCAVLRELHGQTPPIIHRDIKPSNIMIDPRGHAYLLDFNAAKYAHPSQTTVNDSDTVLLGTAGYAAPEQYGFGSSRIQTDIYALGILLREMELSLPHEERLHGLASIIEDCTKLGPVAAYRIDRRTGKTSAGPAEFLLR